MLVPPQEGLINDSLKKLFNLKQFFLNYYRKLFIQFSKLFHQLRLSIFISRNWEREIDCGKNIRRTADPGELEDHKVWTDPELTTAGESHLIMMSGSE